MGILLGIITGALLLAFPQRCLHGGAVANSSPSRPLPDVQLSAYCETDIHISSRYCSGPSVMRCGKAS